MTIRTHISLKSSNTKTGPMVTTYRTEESCPSTCPLLNAGCYADGRIRSIPRKYGREGNEAIVALINEPLTNGIRFNVVGDFVLADDSPDWEYINACNTVAEARPDVAIISYTHAWRIFKPSDFAFVVNASCETAEDAAEAIAAGWQATLVGGEAGEKIAGKRVITCPAQTRDDVTCASCLLCSKGGAGRAVVNFEIHGPTRNKAKRTVAELTAV